jgi:hypothetical protein
MAEISGARSHPAAGRRHHALFQGAATGPGPSAERGSGAAPGLVGRGRRHRLVGDAHAARASSTPEAARRIHPNDPQRIQRALEVHALTGRPMSELIRQQARASSCRIDSSSWCAHRRIARSCASASSSVSIDAESGSGRRGRPTAGTRRSDRRSAVDALGRLSSGLELSRRRHGPWRRCAEKASSHPDNSPSASSPGCVPRHTHWLADDPDPLRGSAFDPCSDAIQPTR